MAYVIGRRFWVCWEKPSDIDGLGAWFLHWWYNGIRVLGVTVERSR